jgi:hypothetical protein
MNIDLTPSNTGVKRGREKSASLLPRSYEMRQTKYPQTALQLSTTFCQQDDTKLNQWLSKQSFQNISKTIHQDVVENSEKISHQALIP